MRAAAAGRRAIAACCVRIPPPPVTPPAAAPHCRPRSLDRYPTGLDSSLRAIASLGYAVSHNEVNVLSPWCTELTLLRVIDC